MDILVPALSDLQGAHLRRFLTAQGYIPTWAAGVAGLYPFHDVVHRTYNLMNEVRVYAFLRLL